MSMNDSLAAALSRIFNSSKIGKKECDIKPVSKIIKTILKIMNENNYVGTFEEIEDGKGNILKLNLLGNINQCGVIKPRYAIKIEDFEKFEKRYLPSKDFGILLISTNKGIMTHFEAKEKKIGGKLFAFCY